MRSVDFDASLPMMLRLHLKKSVVENETIRKEEFLQRYTSSLRNVVPLMRAHIRITRQSLRRKYSAGGFYRSQLFASLISDASRRCDHHHRRDLRVAWLR